MDGNPIKNAVKPYFFIKYSLLSSNNSLNIYYLIYISNINNIYILVIFNISIKMDKNIKNIAKIIIIDKKIAEKFKIFCKNSGFIMQKRIELLIKRDMNMIDLDDGKNEKLNRWIK